MFACPAIDDFFRSRIDHVIDLLGVIPPKNQRCEK